MYKNVVERSRKERTIFTILNNVSNYIYGQYSYIAAISRVALFAHESLR